MMTTDDGKSRVVMIDVGRSRDGGQQVQIFHNFLTNLIGRHRTQASMLDNRWTMTCEYGLQRAGRTRSRDCNLNGVTSGTEETPDDRCDDWRGAGRSGAVRSR